MNRRRGSPPLAERVALGRPAVDQCPGKHCWVTGGAGARDSADKRPGLLIEWRQAGDRWEGRVAYLSLSAAGRWVLTEEWLPASQLAPA